MHALYFLAILIYLMKGLEVTCLFAALVKLGKNVLKRNALLHHHNGEVIYQIGDFINGFAVVAVLCRDDRFAALLAHLFQDLVQTLVEQVAGVGAFLGVVASVFNRRVKRGESFSVVHIKPHFNFLKKQLWRPV